MIYQRIKYHNYLHFLIVNTIFGVFTALKYQSKILFLFYFIFAYINLLLLGTNSSELYTLLIYTLFVSIGTIFIGEKYQDKNVIFLACIFGNILFLIAPTSDEIGFLTKYMLLLLFKKHSV